MEKISKNYIEHEWETFEILWNAYDADDAHNDKTLVEFWAKDWKVFLSDWEKLLELNWENFRTWIYQHYKWNSYQVFWTFRFFDQIFVAYKWNYDHNEERFLDNLRYRKIENFGWDAIKDWKSVSRFQYIWNIL